MKAFLFALQFLTIIPLRGDYTVKQTGRSVICFPLVGVLLGALAGLLNWGLGYVVPQYCVVVFLVVLVVLLTGGLHLDGLADTFDGLAAHRTAEERRQIMRDSRVGGYGVMAIVLDLLLTVTLLFSIPAQLLFPALIAVMAVSRWTMVLVMALFPYAHQSGLGLLFKNEIKSVYVVAGGVIALIVAGITVKVTGIVLFAAASLVAYGVAALLNRLFDGLTGDTYGAINEIATITTLLMLSGAIHLTLL